MFIYKNFKTQNFLPGEFFDRFTILIKKVSIDSEYYKEQIQIYVKVLKKNGLDGDLLQLLCELQVANLDVWFFESQIKAGKEGELELKEVGKMALAVRKFNKIRINKVNEINKLFGIVEKERKIDHASESDIDSL